MLKREFKKRFEENWNSGAKLNIVRDISNATRCGLRRAKFDLLDEIVHIDNVEKAFNKMWSLFTKQEISDIYRARVVQRDREEGIIEFNYKPIKKKNNGTNQD